MQVAGDGLAQDVSLCWCCLCFGEEEEVGFEFVEVRAGLRLQMAALFTWVKE